MENRICESVYPYVPQTIVRSVEEDSPPSTPQLAVWLRLIFTRTGASRSRSWSWEKIGERVVFLDIVRGPVTSLTSKGHSKTDNQLIVSDEEMASLCLKPHSFHGDWNYTLKHRRP